MRGTYIGGPDGQAHKVTQIYIGVLESVDKGIPLDLTNKSVASKYFDVSLGNGASWANKNLEVQTSKDTYESSVTTLQARYKCTIQFQGYDDNPGYVMTIRAQKIDIDGSAVLQILDFEDQQSSTTSTMSLNVGQYLKFSVVNALEYECGTSEEHNPCTSCDNCETYCDSNCDSVCEYVCQGEDEPVCNACNMGDEGCDDCEDYCNYCDYQANVCDQDCDFCDTGNDSICSECDSCDGCQGCQDQTECSEYDDFTTTSSLLNMIVTIDTSAIDISSAHKVSKVYIGDTNGQAKQVYPYGCDECETACQSNCQLNCQDDCELSCEGPCQSGEEGQCTSCDVCETYCDSHYDNDGACASCDYCDGCDSSDAGGCANCDANYQICDRCQSGQTCEDECQACEGNADTCTYCENCEECQANL